MAKNPIPRTHCIDVFIWKDDTSNPSTIHQWKNRDTGMPSMRTGAGSLTAAMKLVRMHLKNGYTHFILSYPVAMQGQTFGNETLKNS